MRDIKFRIYADNKFYYKCLAGNTNDIENKDWTCPMVWLEDKKEWVNCDNGIIQQFTGLYDKNNTPIYEGDIIKSLINTFKIVFKKGCFFAVGINRTQEYTLFEEFEMCNKANVNLEVIGNIYDNEVEE